MNFHPCLSVAIHHFIFTSSELWEKTRRFELELSGWLCCSAVRGL